MFGFHVLDTLLLKLEFPESPRVIVIPLVIFQGQPFIRCSLESTGRVRQHSELLIPMNIEWIIINTHRILMIKKPFYSIFQGEFNDYSFDVHWNQQFRVLPHSSCWFQWTSNEFEKYCYFYFSYERRHVQYIEKTY